MKKALGILSLIVVFTTVGTVTVSAQSNTCNARCQVNDDCATGQRCYVGVCRNTLCPSSTTCGCETTTTPRPSTTPTATPRATSTPRPSTSPTASPTATPKTATVSGKVATPSALKKTPETGFETLIPVGFAIALYASGSVLLKKNTR